ncbi:TPA: hypothetical protein ACGZ9U_003506 [Elizabethkingia anophelis]
MKHSYISVIILILNIITINQSNLKAQKQLDCNNIEKKYQDGKLFFRKNTPSKELVKKCLDKEQKILKIEIINIGDLKDFENTSWIRIVKVNNNLDPILNNAIYNVVSNEMNTKNWKDEYGGYGFNKIEDPIKISQEYTSSGNINDKEIIETTAPVTNFTLKIYTKTKKNTSSDFNKKINIYSDNKLLKTFDFNKEQLLNINGIEIQNFKISYTK